jgi:hypothetical protein
MGCKVGRASSDNGGVQLTTRATTKAGPQYRYSSRIRLVPGGVKPPKPATEEAQIDGEEYGG